MQRIFKLKNFKKYLLKIGENEESLKYSKTFDDKNINNAVKFITEYYPTSKLTNKFVFEICCINSNGLIK